MLRRMLGVLVVLVLAAVGMPSLAFAGTGEDPELTDPCGPQEEIGNDLSPQLALDHRDVCAGWLETLTGPDEAPAIRVSIAFAGDITTRPQATTYYASWRVGDCLYVVRHRDDVDRADADQQFGFRCGPSSRDVPCDPPQPVIACTEGIPVAYTDLPSGVLSLSGNVFSATLVFTQGLAEHAAAHAPGQTLTGLYASAGGTDSAGVVCYGADCGSVGSDSTSRGRDYVVAASGEVVEGPIVPIAPSCSDGSVDTASAANPHVRDLDNDSAIVTIDNPDAQSPGFDIRALWFSRATDGLNLHILPAGPADVPNTLYWAEFNGHFARAEGQPDGSWAATAGPLGTNVIGGKAFEGPATSATMDPATGEIVIALPAALLPADEVLLLSNYMSHYIVAGDAPRTAAGISSHSVDTPSGGVLFCEAYR